MLRAECCTTDELLAQLKIALDHSQLLLAYEICWAIAEHVVVEE